MSRSQFVVVTLCTGLASVLWLPSCTLDFSGFRVADRTTEPNPVDDDPDPDPNEDPCGNRSLDPTEACDPGIVSGVGSCPKTCPPDDPCVSWVLRGSDEECSTRCEIVSEITTAATGDGCCPGGATYDQDMDCDPLCGNGKLDDGEECEDGTGKPCVRSAEACAPRDCQVVTLEGRNCQAKCVYDDVAPIDGDGCCVGRANSRTDADCDPVCGNAVVDRGETCDPAALRGCPMGQADCDASSDVASDPCRPALFVAGEAGNVCGNECALQERITTPTPGDGCCPSGATIDVDSDCTQEQAVCGNSILEPDEECDTGARSPAPCDAVETNCAALPASTCQRRVVVEPDGPCSRACITEKVEQCEDGDGCCPTACDSGSDSDCMEVPTCGNGDLDPGETCDGDDCLTPCAPPAPDACVMEVPTGNPAMCTAECVDVSVNCDDTDGICCASSCNARNDTDCPAACGNGVRELGETCDGADDCAALACEDDGDPCTIEATTGSVDTCDVDCERNRVTELGLADGCCVDDADFELDPDCPGCGDGVLQSQEACDLGITEGAGACPSACPDGEALEGEGCQATCVPVPAP